MFSVADTNIRTNVHSQHGEDGIIEHLLHTFNIEIGTCCEFGAWDGIHLSNTFNLISNKGWNGILIEGNPRKFQELRANMAQYKGVITVNALVGLEGPTRLDEILKSCNAEKDFDLLSIDIDGCDYYIWESLQDYRPKIIVIEYNPTIPNCVDFVQGKDFSLTHGASIKSLRDLGLKKGYQLAYVTPTNGIFVRDDLYPLLGIEDNSLDKLRNPYEGAYILYQLFDGTIKLHGKPFLRWHGIPIREEDIQILPKMMRFFPDNAPIYAQYYYAYLKHVRPHIKQGFSRLKAKMNFIFHSLGAKLK